MYILSVKLASKTVSVLKLQMQTHLNLLKDVKKNLLLRCDGPRYKQISTYILRVSYITEKLN